jgi:hypothetical protein
MFDFDCEKIKEYCMSRHFIVICSVAILLLIGIGYYLCKNNILFGGDNNSLVNDINNLNEKARVTLFYADRCPACKLAKPSWFETKNHLNNSIINNTHIEMTEVDGDNNLSELSKYNVDSYPTVVLITDNKYTLYGGTSYDKNSIESFIKSNT